jgi:hypothetical protein
VEIDIADIEHNWIRAMATAILVALLLLGFTAIGKQMTPVNELGQPRVMNFDDWKVHQATKQYNREIAVLRDDIRDVAVLLQGSPNPIAAQVLLDRVRQNTKKGAQSSLLARTLTLEAAEKALSWANGTTNHLSAISAVDKAVEVLK